jgi:hypothetical protein
MRRRLAVLGLLAGLGAAFTLLPWWGSLALLVALAVGARFAGGRVVRHLLIGAFRAKGAVLAGARARIHSILPAPPYEREDEAEGAEGLEGEPRTWRWIDLTIEVPGRDPGKAGPFSLWDPSELMIVSPETRSGEALMEDTSSIGEIHGVEVWDGGAWVALDGKLCGTQRLRLHASAPRGVERFKLRYYFELIAKAA